MAACAPRPWHRPHSNRTKMSLETVSPEPSAQTGGVTGACGNPCLRPAQGSHSLKPHGLLTSSGSKNVI